MLMSFISSIGTLMQGSGLEDILNAAFKGVSSMLNGKAWPKALRGFRMVVSSLLEDFILDGKTIMQSRLKLSLTMHVELSLVDCGLTVL